MKILVIQNRMGIGDTVIFLPYIKAISRKFRTPVSLLVKESSKADQFLEKTSYIDNIIILERDKENLGKHEGILGSLNLIKDLKKYNFNKVFIFNSSFRFNLIAKLSKIPNIYQYPLFKKSNQHITDTAKKFIKRNLNIDVNEDPEIEIIDKVASNINVDSKNTNILLGIGGSGPTKRIPSKTFIKVIDELSKDKKCTFYLATGKNNEEQIILKEILESKYSKSCVALDDLSIKEILPIIKRCHVSVCNDSSFSHLSAALGIKTITLMADTPLIYGNYSSKMHPIIPDGTETVNHKTLGKENINPDKIIKKLFELLN
jgi:heptosyltransferase-2